MTITVQLHEGTMIEVDVTDNSELALCFEHDRVLHAEHGKLATAIGNVITAVLSATGSSAQGAAILLAAGARLARDANWPMDSAAAYTRSHWRMKWAREEVLRRARAKTAN